MLKPCTRLWFRATTRLSTRLSKASPSRDKKVVPTPPLFASGDRRVLQRLMSANPALTRRVKLDANKVTPELISMDTLVDLRQIPRTVHGRGPSTGSKFGGAGKEYRGPQKHLTRTDSTKFNHEHSMLSRLPQLKREPLEFHEYMTTVTLADLQMWIDTRRLDPERDGVITPFVLNKLRLIRQLPKWPGVRLSADGYEFFQAKVRVRLNWVDEDAVKVIERNGGEAVSMYMDRLYYYRRGKDCHPQLPRPPIWKLYRNPAIRGYLHGQDHLMEQMKEHYTFPWDEASLAQAEATLQTEQAQVDTQRQRQQAAEARRVEALRVQALAGRKVDTLTTAGAAQDKKPKKVLGKRKKKAVRGQRKNASKADSTK